MELHDAPSSFQAMDECLENLLLEQRDAHRDY
jgi:hypothetical protein